MFMYKVYTNNLLNEMSQHSFAICINHLNPSSPSFADDISLLALQPTSLETFMSLSYKYSLLWCFEINNSKSGDVVFGETEAVHALNMKGRSSAVGNGSVDQMNEYNNLAVLKKFFPWEVAGKTKCLEYVWYC